MFRQTQVERARASSTASESGFRQLVGDIVELAELQLQLLAVDGREAGRRSIKAAIAAAGSLVVMLAAVTTGLIGLGHVLYEQLQWPLGASLLVVAAVALLVAGILGAIGYVLMRRAADSMKESSSELAENVQWIRNVLSQPDLPNNRGRVEPLAQAPWPPSDRF